MSSRSPAVRERMHPGEWLRPSPALAAGAGHNLSGWYPELRSRWATSSHQRHRYIEAHRCRKRPAPVAPGPRSAEQTIRPTCIWFQLLGRNLERVAPCLVLVGKQSQFVESTTKWMDPICPCTLWSARNGGGQRYFRVKPPSCRSSCPQEPRSLRPTTQGSRPAASRASRAWGGPNGTGRPEAP